MRVRLKKRHFKILLIAFLVALAVEGILAYIEREDGALRFEKYPAYNGNPYVIINGNVPYFNDSEKASKSCFEYYGNLDSLGRCTEAVACIGIPTMPKEEREDISSVLPTGWQVCRYNFIDGGYLYNRCHLIGFQLTGENANEKNLITGTRYMNVDGMQPFEDIVADYVKETGNRVMYRVTPSFDKDNLIADGVYIEAYSVDDGGRGICFCVFVYNVQPRVKIDYKSGESIEI